MTIKKNTAVMVLSMRYEPRKIAVLKLKTRCVRVCVYDLVQIQHKIVHVHTPYVLLVLYTFQGACPSSPRNCPWPRCRRKARILLA